MKLLLDTHAFLWFVMGDARLSKTARAVIEDPANDKVVSAASHWEVAIKAATGKLTLAEPFHILVPREISSNGFDILPIGLAHSSAVVNLPFHHLDPFDRMLIAQAIVEQLPIITADAQFDAYGITRVW